MTDKRVEDIVLYHGSLEELNSRNPEKQYRFAEELFYISHTYTFDIIHGSLEALRSFDSIKKELADLGCDGIVNCRTIADQRFPTGQPHANYRIEGTPIVRA